MIDQATIPLDDVMPAFEDDAICFAVATALGCACIALDRVRVAFCAECIVLTGELNSYYLKQLAQTIAKSVSGVGRLRNDIVVPGH